MIDRVTLVLGGARSGKSAWAEQHAAASGLPVLYVATATAGDDEMAARISAHKSQRPADWRTLEAPRQLADAIRASASPGTAVLIDCLTLWVSNELLATIGEQDPDRVPAAIWTDIEAKLVSETRDLVEIARERALQMILVSNEVGMGIVPATVLGRGYRDVLGRVNQTVASQADAVIFMIAGLAVDLRLLTVDR